MKNICSFFRLLMMSVSLFMLACVSESENQRHSVPDISLVQIKFDHYDQQKIIEVEEIAKIIKIEDPLFYRWKNYLVFSGTEKAAKAFYNTLKEKYPKQKINFVSEPFYYFNRHYCSERKGKSIQKKSILLTANLVESNKMQEEYFAYHKKQFKEWPEVAQGFCQAEFEDVLLYRSERQLLLMINIPEGLDFQTLNEKTVQNNPRVDAWNKLMANYQEGLPGTAENETWVFLDKQ